MKALIAGTMLVLAGAASAAPNPFFVFDNGLHGEKLKTIDAQLDLVKSVGFAGLSWRTDAPERVKQVLDGVKQRGLKLFTIYIKLELKDGKLVYHGAIDDSQKADQVEKHFLQDAIDAATAGKDIPVKETKFVGCGIKFRTKT